MTFELTKTNYYVETLTKTTLPISKNQPYGAHDFQSIICV